MRRQWDALEKALSQKEALDMSQPISTRIGPVQSNAGQSPGKQPTPSTPETTIRDASVTQKPMERSVAKMPMSQNSKKNKSL
jgi:hypothetical protein